MKTLYESILDNDFDIDNRSAAAMAIQEILAQPYNCNVTVKFVEDKFVVDFRANCLCKKAGEILKIMEVTGVKKIVFNGCMTFIFERSAIFDGFDISAEFGGIILGNNCKVTFENCTFRFAEDLQCRGSLTANPNGKLVLGKGTTVYALSLELVTLNCEMKGTAQLNLISALYITRPTDTQLRWMKKNNIPLSYDDTQNQMSPDMWTDPLYGLLKTKKSVTNYVEIRRYDSDLIYKFYSANPEYTIDEMMCFDLASGWTLIIDRK